MGGSRRVQKDPGGCRGLVRSGIFRGGPLRSRRTRRVPERPGGSRRVQEDYEVREGPGGSGRHISLDSEWNDTPFLQKRSAHSIPAGMEWPFHSCRNGVLIATCRNGIKSFHSCRTGMTSFHSSQFSSSTSRVRTKLLTILINSTTHLQTTVSGSQAILSMRSTNPC